MRKRWCSVLKFLHFGAVAHECLTLVRYKKMLDCRLISSRHPITENSAWNSKKKTVTLILVYCTYGAPKLTSISKNNALQPAIYHRKSFQMKTRTLRETPISIFKLTSYSNVNLNWRHSPFGYRNVYFGYKLEDVSCYQGNRSLSAESINIQKSTQVALRAEIYFRG